MVLRITRVILETTRFITNNHNAHTQTIHRTSIGICNSRTKEKSTANINNADLLSRTPLIFSLSFFWFLSLSVWIILSLFFYLRLNSCKKTSSLSRMFIILVLYLPFSVHHHHRRSSFSETSVNALRSISMIDHWCYSTFSSVYSCAQCSERKLETISDICRLASFLHFLFQIFFPSFSVGFRHLTFPFSSSSSCSSLIRLLCFSLTFFLVINEHQ